MAAVGSGAAWLALVAGGAPGGAAAGAAPPVPIVAAAVDAAGTPVGPPAGWTVTHPELGVYEVTFAEPTTVAVRTWSAAATVTAVPVSPLRWRVTFTAADEPVDAAFSFLAAPAP